MELNENMSEALAYQEKEYEFENMNYRMPMLRSEVNIVRHDIDTLRTDVSELKKDTNIIKSEISELKKDVRILQSDASELKSDLKNIHIEINDLKGDLKVINARIDNMDKRFDDFAKSQNGWFMTIGFLVAAVPIAIAIVQHFIGR